jgi:hypothetical protein
MVAARLSRLDWVRRRQSAIDGAEAMAMRVSFQVEIRWVIGVLWYKLIAVCCHLNWAGLVGL